MPFLPPVLGNLIYASYCRVERHAQVVGREVFGVLRDFLCKKPHCQGRPQECHNEQHAQWPRCISMAQKGRDVSWLHDAQVRLEAHQSLQLQTPGAIVVCAPLAFQPYAVAARKGARAVLTSGGSGWVAAVGSCHGDVVSKNQVSSAAGCCSGGRLLVQC